MRWVGTGKLAPQAVTDAPMMTALIMVLILISLET
jgi:hypothetical protein